MLNCEVLGFGYCPRTLFHIIYERNDVMLAALTDEGSFV